MTRTLPPKFLRTITSRISPTLIPSTHTLSTIRSGWLACSNARQIAGLTAFAGHEAEILESVGKEQSEVLFAVDDAGSGRQLPMPEVRCARMLAKDDLLHAALQQIPRRHWYIRVEVAITEICGGSQDYFSRVKAANKNKSFRRSSRLSGPLPRVG